MIIKLDTPIFDRDYVIKVVYPTNADYLIALKTKADQ